MSEFRELQLDKIDIGPTNPRTEFDTESLSELSKSIIIHGILQPIIVRYHPDEAAKNDDVFQLVCGERRYRASILAGSQTIPASIRELNDDEVFELQIIENLERKDVHPMDEAIAFKKMIDSGKYTMEDISAKIAKTPTFVAQRLKLNDLVPELQEEFLKGEFGIGHAVLLSRIGLDQQQEIFQGSKDKWNPGYGTVSELKQSLERSNNDLDEAIFPLADKQLLPKAGACMNCSKNSFANPILFPEEKEENLCFDKSCYKEKESVFYYQKVDSVIKENPGVILVDNYYNSKRNIVESLLKENDKTVLQSYSEYSEDDSGNTVAFHLDKLHYINIILKEGAKVKNVSSDPNENIKKEISSLKDRANRALELDREKIYKRSIDELVKDETKREVLFSMDPLSENEKKALFSTLMSYDNEKWLKELTGAKDIGYSITRADFIREYYSDELLNAVIRKHLKRELVSESLLDYKKQENPSFYFEILKDYFPNEVELFTDEQNDVAAKRIERSDKKIKDLEKIVKSSSTDTPSLSEDFKSSAEETMSEVNDQDEADHEERCSKCFRSNEDFLEEFGYPGMFKDGICHPCAISENK